MTSLQSKTADLEKTLNLDSAPVINDRGHSVQTAFSVYVYWTGKKARQRKTDRQDYKLGDFPIGDFKEGDAEASAYWREQAMEWADVEAAKYLQSKEVREILGNVKVSFNYTKIVDEGEGWQSRTVALFDPRSFSMTLVGFSK